MNKISQFFYRLIFLFLLSFPLLLTAQNKQVVKADLIGVDRRMMEADSLDQPQKAIELAQSLYNLATKTGNVGLQYKALSYELRNRNRLNPGDKTANLDLFLSKIQTLKEADYKAIGLLCYLENSNSPFSNETDSVIYTRRNKISKELLDLIPLCKKNLTENYKTILDVNYISGAIAPTLDLYLSSAWLMQWQSRRNKDSDFYSQFMTVLTSSDKPAAVMYSNYISDVQTASGNTARRIQLKALISKYNAIPEVGFLYNQLQEVKPKEYIEMLESYINRFPQSAYSVLFRNKIDNLKASSVTVTLPLQNNEREKTPLDIIYYRTKEFELDLNKNGVSKSIFFPLTISNDYEKDTTTQTIPPLKKGQYNIVLNKDTRPVTLSISNMASYQVNNFIYAVDFNTGKPLNNASIAIKVRERELLHKIKNGTFNTNSIKRELKDKYSLWYNLKRGDELSARGIMIYYSMKDFDFIPENHSDKIITNKPIYKPGDSISFKGWVWRATPFGFNKPEEQSVIVELINPEFKPVDSVVCYINKFGTFDGKMQIPAQGLNGDYRLSAESKWKKERNFTYGFFRVENYIAPTFKINMNSNKRQYSTTDSITISGDVTSFNGLPVSNEEVKYNISFSYLLRAIAPVYNKNISGTTMTDSKGQFSFKTSLAELNSIDNTFGIRGKVSATVTNKNGETEEGTCSFLIADKPYNLTIKGSDFLDLNNLSATYELIANTPVNGSVKTSGSWRLENSKGNIIKSGNWTADNKFALELPAGFAVGRYKLICETTDSIKAQKKLLIFNSKSGEMPVDTALLLIPGIGNTLYVGTSEKEIYIRSIWKVGNKPTEEKWITLSKGLHHWPLADIEKGYNALLSLITVKNKKFYKGDFKVNNPIKTDSIYITIETFRDHLTPGAKETWSMTLSQNGSHVNSASTLAFMYDEALNSIEGFNPSLDLKLPIFSISNAAFEGKCFNSDKLIYRKNYPLTNDTILSEIYPNFRFNRATCVDVPIYIGSKSVIVRGVGLASTAMASNAKRSNAISMDQDIPESNNLFTPGPSSSIRSNFADCAFFYPNLPVSSDGKVTFSFTLPDLITTWRFVAIANNEKMEVGQIQQSFVAQKELMLQINEPRFLRQGDQTEIEATVSFLKPHSGATTVTMELVDATTEKVITSTEKQISGSEQVLKVNFPLSVPANTDRIILRMRASNGNFSDGEQYLIPVLSPDIELTQTLELNTGGNTDMKFQWKELNEQILNNTHSAFRIELVKNPAWYTVNALSALLNPSSVSADALINAYFANTLGEAIAKANPDIEMYLIEKAKSPLSGKTANTPWVNEEEQETKQIQQALLLYNPGQIEYLRSSAFAKLKQLQNEDGGFSWYPGMGSSVWQTLTVLQRMGELTELGVIEYGQTEKMMQIDALKYIDKYIADTYLNEVKYKTTDKPLNSTQAQILCVRAMYMDIPLTGEALTGHKNWTSRASKSWIGNDLYTKSLLANALFAYGFTNDAKEIVTSILNYGVESPTLGFWFPSNQSDKLQTQVAMMRLMLNPQVNQPKRFEQMKWWLIAQKQNRMWPTSATTVDAVYALTMQGTNVLNASGSLSVMLGSKELKSRDNMILLQNIAVPDLIAANGEIRVVNQTPLPVFGALYRTFLTPVKSVKGNNKGALQIQKEIIRTSNESLKVGEEVTVRLTVKSSQALDFVQIQDQLAACYQPVDQKSGYSWMQVACYKELTNENINFFIETLPRGTTVFEYKVWINRPGAYQSGVAKIESVYNPQFTNYSDNCELDVK